MNQLLFLLLPLAAAAGWFAAVHSLRRRVTRRQPVGFSSDYFRGLNYLLNEQPDKAIEVFVKMLEVDPDTVEMHLALGNLFRQRGEVDRAIRIHQNLVARNNLDSEQRSMALLELAQDYMRAGLLDRAESLFLELVELNEHPVAGLRHLLVIYQQEKDWERAITIARRLESATGEPMNAEIAQFYCELAESAWNRARRGEAGELAEQALRTDPKGVRGSLIVGRIAAAEGRWREAIEALTGVESQDPDFLPETLPLLKQCYGHTGSRSELIAFLHHCLTAHGGISVMLSLADLLSQEHGDEEAAEFIIEQLRQRPSVRGLDRLIQLHLAHTEGAAQESLTILKDLTTKLLENEPVYRCRSCGFSGRSLHWQCPSCKQWNTVKPIHGVVGE